MLAVMPGRPPRESTRELTRIEIVSDPPPSKAVLFLMAQGAFEQEPLALVFQAERSHERAELVGVANRRRSDILDGWYETITVRVNVSYRRRPPSNGREPEVEVAAVHVALTIFVSRQDTDRPLDWRQPTADQLESYRSAVLAAFQSRLRPVCEDGTWEERDRLVCP